MEYAMVIYGVAYVGFMVAAARDRDIGNHVGCSMRDRINGGA